MANSCVKRLVFGLFDRGKLFFIMANSKTPYARYFSRLNPIYLTEMDACSVRIPSSECTVIAGENNNQLCGEPVGVD
jgi:hypothetical protein